MQTAGTVPTVRRTLTDDELAAIMAGSK